MTGTLSQGEGNDWQQLTTGFHLKLSWHIWAAVHLQGQSLPAMLADAPALRTPWLGLTQYLFGAVVFTLKVTFLSEVFVILRLLLDTSSLKGPGTESQTQFVNAFDSANGQKY